MQLSVCDFLLNPDDCFTDFLQMIRDDCNNDCLLIQKNTFFGKYNINI